MNTPPFLALLSAMAAGLFLSGCATPDKSDAKSESYTDPASGVVFPEHFASLDRISLNKDDTDKNPVSAHYGATEQFNADIRVIPSSETTPDQLLGQTIRSCENHPNFAQNDYRGAKSFGNERAFCTQCSFDRAASGDRVTFKIVLIPHGNYLMCFTFLVRATQEDQWQSVIDSFIQNIVTASGKKVNMSPNNLMLPAPAPDQG